MAPPWRPTPLLRASFALHAVVLAALAWQPRVWPWALGALLANHALLTAAGLWPRSALLGPNLTRLPPASRARGEIALTIDDGPDPQVTPRVLDLLDAHGARATFFCIGARARAHPGLCRDIVGRGHAIENHTERHRHTFSLSGPAALAREIGAAQTSLRAAGGGTPRFFRAPAGLRNPFLDPVLHAAGLRLASWTRRGFDTRCADAPTVLRRLERGLRAGDILLLHDGHAARDAHGTPVILEVLPPLLAAIERAGLRTVTLRQAFESA